MARTSTRNAKLSIDLDGGAVLTEVKVNKVSISSAIDFQDVTCFGDPSKVYVADVPDFSGSFEGPYDDASFASWDASVDGEPRAFLLIVDRTSIDAEQDVFEGEVLLDFAIDIGIGSAGTVKASFRSAGIGITRRRGFTIVP